MRTCLLSPPPCCTTPSTLMAKTGRTHGIRFSIKPPSRAIPRIDASRTKFTLSFVYQVSSIRIGNSTATFLSTSVTISASLARVASERDATGTRKTTLCEWSLNLFVALLNRKWLGPSTNRMGSSNSPSIRSPRINSCLGTPPNKEPSSIVILLSVGRTGTFAKYLSIS